MKVVLNEKINSFIFIYGLVIRIAYVYDILIA